MKIGIVGGTFDPVHKAHVQIAIESYQQLALDEVWFIPVLNNPFSKDIVATAKQRIEMLKIALRKYPMFKINDIELKSDDAISYTVDTLKRLKKRYTEHQFYYILGFDQVNAFDKWYKANEIAEMAQIVCFKRKGYNQHENIDVFNMIELPIKATDTSSSAIKKGDLENIDKKVIRYFVSEGLYLDTILKERLSKKRYEHTISMANLAKEIARNNNVDTKKAYVTGLLHDVAKELPKEKTLKIMNKHYKEHLDQPYSLYHQWTGAYIAKKEFKVKDEEMLHAISVHTTGDTNMSQLDKVIFVADKYDPYRGYDSSKQIALCMEDLDEGFKLGLKENLEYLKKIGKPMSPVSQEVYEKYVEENNE